MSYDTLAPSTLDLIGVRVKAGDKMTFREMLEADPNWIGKLFGVEELIVEVRWNPDPLAAYDWRLAVESGVRCKLTRRGPRRRTTWRPWSAMKVLGTRR